MHCGWGVLEGEEGHHGVGFEELVDVCRRGFCDGGWAEESGGGNEDVKSEKIYQLEISSCLDFFHVPSPSIQHIVNELQSVLFIGELEWIPNDFGIWESCVDVRFKARIVVLWR